MVTTQRSQWHPTPVLLTGKSHGQRSLVGCSSWGREESDTTERLHFHFSLSPAPREGGQAGCSEFSLSWDKGLCRGGGSSPGLSAAASCKPSPSSQAPRRAVCGTRGSLRTMHGGGLKGVQPPLPFGERTRDCSPGHAGKEGPQLACPPTSCSPLLPSRREDTSLLL